MPINLLHQIQQLLNWPQQLVAVEKRNVFVVYFLVLLATSLDNLNSTAALTMTANIEKEFHTDSSTASWVLSGYALTLGSFIMISGKIADIIGPHNLFLIGLTSVWICALICACIPHSSIITLIVFRAIQGIGASSLVPSTIALAANYFTGRYAKYLPAAIIGFIISLTGTLGFGIILGGAFSETLIGYRSFFFFVFAFGFFCDLVLLFLIIPIKKTTEHANLKMKNIDFIGSALVIVGILLIILGLTEGGENWRSPKAYMPLIVGFFTFVCALVFEILYIQRFKTKHRHLDKASDWRLQMELLFPPDIIRIPNFLPFLIVCGLYYATFTMMLAVGIEYYSFIEEASPIISAIKVFPLTVGLVFGAIIYRASYYEKVGLRNMFILSAALTLGSCVWFSRTNYEVLNSYWKFGIGSLFLYGYGMNIFFNIYIGAVVANTPLHLQGVVNGIYQTCSQVLLSIGNALVPSILGNLQRATNERMKHELHAKFQSVFYVIMGFHATVFFIMVLFVRNLKKKEEPESEMIDDSVKNEDVCVSTT